MTFKQFVARVYDLPNAYRVLDIMDKAGGCDIDRVEDLPDHWHITLKRYLPEQDARDLQTITLFDRQYKHRSPLWNKLFFSHFRDGVRILKNWI